MTDVIIGILAVPLNLIIYYLFGALILKANKRPVNEGLLLIVGFFTYHILFFVVLFPFMIKYRPFSWFVKTFLPILIVILLVSLIINFSHIKGLITEGILFLKREKLISVIVLAVILLQVIIVTGTYNFTLDAAYYVSNVTTTLQTDMINVYDPFTGSWLDHYEVRYLFATYSINDAFMCKILTIPALIQTKLTMSAVVIIMVNVLYIMIAKCLYNDDLRGVAIMVSLMFIVNILFYTIFTSSLFLFTRTYEGKTIIGNLSVLTIFYIFMLLINDEEINLPWLSMFIISLGSVTVSSSGNMLIPATLSLLFVPYMIIKKTLKPLIKYICCLLPGVVMVAVYILYIEGYFVLYTYPR